MSVDITSQATLASSSFHGTVALLVACISPKAGTLTQLEFSSFDVFLVAWSCSSCVVLRGSFRVVLLGHAYSASLTFKSRPPGTPPSLQWPM